MHNAYLLAINHLSICTNTDYPLMFAAHKSFEYNPIEKSTIMPKGKS